MVEPDQNMVKTELDERNDLVQERSFSEFQIGRIGCKYELPFLTFNVISDDIAVIGVIINKENIIANL
jgi:hypothetical protein